MKQHPLVPTSIWTSPRSNREWVFTRRRIRWQRRVREQQKRFNEEMWDMVQARCSFERDEEQAPERVVIQ